MLADGTPAEGDQVGNGQGDHSGKRRKHGVNIQAVTDPNGEPIWYFACPAWTDREHHRCPHSHEHGPTRHPSAV